MGTLHTVFILDEIINSQEGVEWLEKWGISKPDKSPPGRMPTLSELKQVLSEKDEYDIEYREGNRNLYVTISSMLDDAWAFLVVTDYDSEKPGLDATCEFHFETGWEEVIRDIIQSLANTFGPYVWTKNGENPEILMPA